MPAYELDAPDDDYPGQYYPGDYPEERYYPGNPRIPGDRPTSPARPYVEQEGAADPREWDDSALPGPDGYADEQPAESFPYGDPAGNARGGRGNRGRH